MTCVDIRELKGYPGAFVQLHVEWLPEGGEGIRVRITDPVGETEWVPKNRRQAKDMYFHPFAYGYTYPTRGE